MPNLANRKQSKPRRTMRNPKVIEILFMRDESEFTESRVEEARNLIAQMILLGEAAKEKKGSKSA